MDGLKFIPQVASTIFQFKGIRIEVNDYKILDEPNRLGGRYCIIGSKVLNAVVYVNGIGHNTSISGHFVIEQVMKDLDARSWNKSAPPPHW